jgi:hypothetical protein
MRNANEILIGNPPKKGKRSLHTPRRRWEDNIKRYQKTKDVIV